MAVSYLQPPSGFLEEGGRWVDSEWVERGEALPWGEGDREWKDRFRERWYGVDGRELDWCEVSSGRPGESAGASPANFQVMLEGFVEPIGEDPPGEADDLASPWMSEIIQ
jgi:hypothetical protein